MTELSLDGECVRLRDWRPDDAEVVRYWLNPAHRWHDTNGPYFGRPTSAQADAKAQRIAMGGPLPVPRQDLAIVEPREDRLIGEVSWYWESEATDWRRMGLVVFDDSCWGRGYGSDALRLWTSYLFATTAVLRLDYATYSGNPAMIAVGRRLGFVEEARFRNARPWQGKVYDAVVMGVLREEWHHLIS